MTKLNLRRLSTIICLIPFIWWVGCATSKTFRGQDNNLNIISQYWLTVSLYAGNFFDDRNFFLLDHRPFYAIDDVRTKDGYTYFPAKETLLIPAGTLVKIVRVEYPDEKIMLKRSIYSPKNHIWIYLKVARERGDINIFYDKIYIMIIPKNITDELQLKKYLDQFFSLNDPNRWMLQSESFIQKGMFEKKPVIGMNKEHIFVALGPAIRKQNEEGLSGEDKEEIWQYHNFLVYFHGNRVTKVKNIAPK
jgi:hypothetical protein